MTDESAPAELGRVPLLASVGVTVGALSTTEHDAALVHLAQLVAEQIDRSGAIARSASKLARDTMAELGADSAIYERVQALQAKVGERDAVDRLGARLLAVLVELGATPRARAKDGAPAAPGAHVVTALGKLRGVPS